MSEGSNIFDREAYKYDAWFDSPDGRVLFENELAGLVTAAGFEIRQWAATLTRPPSMPVGRELPVAGRIAEAGFVCLLAVTSRT